MNFGQAVEALKKGNKVARTGWNGKGMFVYMVRAIRYDKDRLPNESYGHLKDCDSCGDSTGVVTFNTYFAIKNVDGTVSTWVPSVNDCLSEDWGEAA